jgi:hypothetical protein
VIAAAFIRRWWPYLLAGAAIVGVVGTITVQAKRIDALQGQLITAKADAKAAKAQAKASEALRGQERDQARASFASADTRCSQRIITARDAGEAIGEIVNYGTDSHTGGPSDPARYSQGGTADRPNRGIVPAGQLRRVIGQAAAADRAVGLPVGSNSGAAK